MSNLDVEMAEVIVNLAKENQALKAKIQELELAELIRKKEK